MNNNLLLACICLICLSTSLKAQTNYVANSVNNSTNGRYNTLVGPGAGPSATGEQNTAVGYGAGNALTSGNVNSFFGWAAGRSNSTGDNNVFVGAAAGYSNTDGGLNTFVGHYAGVSNTTGGLNLYLGYVAGYSNTQGGYNCFLGPQAGYTNSTGSSNVFSGYQAGYSNSTGSYNGFSGTGAGYSNTSGGNNTFVGYQAGYKNTTGSNNIIIGPSSGTAITTSNDNVLMGYNSQAQDGLQNAIAIGANSRVAASNSMILGNGVNVGIGTSTPTNRLQIVSESPNTSGLTLSNLTNDSPTTRATDQFLTVSQTGEVVKARYQLRINNPSEWSDKVFSSSYQLRPLSSVATFISQHGHLAGIPSAEQVAKEGMDLVKMNSLLLEKVEELTLYSIQLEKTAQHLHQKDKKQQQEIDELKRLMKSVLQKR